MTDIVKQNPNDVDYVDESIRFANVIEVCGQCGRRIWRIGPDGTQLYCEKGGRKHANYPTVKYIKAPVEGNTGTSTMSNSSLTVSSS